MIFSAPQIQRIPTPLLWVGNKRYTPYVRPLAAQRAALSGATYALTSIAAVAAPTKQRSGIKPVCRLTMDGRRRVLMSGGLRAIVWGNYRASPVLTPAEPATQNTTLATWAYHGNPEATETDDAAQSVTLTANTYAAQHTTTGTAATTQKTAISGTRIQPSGNYESAQPLRQTVTLSTFSYAEK